MTSLLHEAPLLLIEDRPALLLDLVRQVGQDLPAFEELRLEAADHTEVLTLEGRSDRVAVLYRVEPDAAGERRSRPVLAIINESQTCPDEEKWWSWPFYHAGLRKKLRCRVWILVVTLDEKVAAWARQPVPEFDPGGQGSFAPLVLGPQQIPVVRDAEQARAQPELSVLSAMAHGDSDPAVLKTTLGAIQGLPKDKRVNYEQMILATMRERGIQILEEYWMQITEQQWAEVFENTPGGKYFIERMGRCMEARWKSEGERLGITALCEVLGIELTAERQRQLRGLDTAGLTALRQHLQTERAWPQDVPNVPSR